MTRNAVEGATTGSPPSAGTILCRDPLDQRSCRVTPAREDNATRWLYRPLSPLVPTGRGPLQTRSRVLCLGVSAALIGSTMSLAISSRPYPLATSSATAAYHVRQAT